MNARVEDLAQKMVKARQLRDQKKQTAINRQLSHSTNTRTREHFFQRKAEMAEKEASEKEKRIKEMELREAELLEKIKRTQNLQLEEFNKLEEVMYEQ